MRKHVLAIAVVAVTVFGGATSAASADVLESYNTGTATWATVPTVAPNNWLVGQLASGSTALLETDLGDVTCTVSTVRGQVTENPGNPAAGAVLGVDDVEGGITHLTFTSCSDNSGLFDLRNCTATSGPVVAYASTTTPFPVRADADPAVDVFALSGINVDVCIDPVLGSNANCKYTGTANGSITSATGNPPSTPAKVIFTQEPVTSTTGFPCPTASTFTATYDVKHDIDADGVYEASDRHLRLLN